MGLILTATAGLCLWIVLWAMGIKGFDAILIGGVMTLVAISLRNVIAGLFGGRDPLDR
jgi:hypothetical protein